MARSHLEGYPHLRKFANYQVHQRVCTKKKTPAGSRQNPAHACRVSKVGPTASTPCSRLERRLSFTLAGFRGGGAIGYFLRCRHVRALRRRWRWYSEKTLERNVQEGVYYLESLSLPTRAANLVWWPNSPTWRRRFSTKLQRLYLPASHPNTVDLRLERVVEVNV